MATLAMYLKVMTLSVAYITLARGYSLSYLFLETSYYVAFIVLFIVGYEHWGLYGTGIAVALAHLFEYVLVNAYAYKKYGYRFSATVSGYAIVQTGIGLLLFLVTLLAEGLLYWGTGLLLVALSLCLSLHVLRRKTHLWNALVRRFRRG